MPPKASKSKTPERSGGPAITWLHRDLYDRVRLAISALPAHFTSSLDIEGVSATDLFSFNSALGTTIEDQVVEALNRMRPVWDPESKYQVYRFERQPQTFPDVRLVTHAPGHTEPILMGIELKGWFVISKEGEPSFRYTVTPSACAAADLLVVVPWIFRNVISGTPLLLSPFVEEARFAADMRNFHWQHVRGTGAAKDRVITAAHKTPYPSKKNNSSDRAKNDGGGNFGRVARANIMEKFVTEIMQHRAAGIPVFAWQKFLRAFSEGADETRILREIGRIEGELSEDLALTFAEREQLAHYFEAIAGRLRGT